MGQNPLQAPLIQMQHAVKDAFGCSPPMVMFFLSGCLLLLCFRFFMESTLSKAFSFEQTAAQHWSQSKRYKPRYQNCGADSNGKLSKQPAQNSAHEENRDEYRHQRYRHRY